MPDHRLIARPALGLAAPKTETLGPVRLAEVTDTALASLASRRGREGAVAAIAGQIGLPLPPPGCAASGPIWSAFWLGPDQWMLEAPAATHEDIAVPLRAAFGQAASITEQSGAWVRIDVFAPDLPALFERLSAQDTRAMQPGSATRTVIEHLGTYLIRRPDRMTLLGPRSSADALWHALATAAGSVF